MDRAKAGGSVTPEKAASLAMRKLPSWIGGAEVTDLTYQVVVCHFEDAYTIDTLAEKLNVDEADILRAYAELRRAGVMGIV